MTAKASFKQADVERMIRAAQALGLPIAEVMVKDGEEPGVRLRTS
jgi:hypothetical protein